MDALNLTYADYCFDSRGGFRQRELRVTQTYDTAYLAERYGGAMDARVRSLASRRLEVLSAFCSAAGRGRLLDFGCGTGWLYRLANASGWTADGYDVLAGHASLLSLREAMRRPWDVLTFFDSLEHLADPDAAIKALSPEWVMVSVPWCHYPGDPGWFTAWKHRRPGEHLWHWGRHGLDALLHGCGYRAVMHSSFEDDWRPNPDQAEPNILTAIYRRRVAAGRAAAA